MNTRLPVLTVWLPGPGEAHATDRAGIAIPEPLFIDVLADPDIAPPADGVLVDVSDEPQPATAIATAIASRIGPSRRLRAPGCMSYLHDAELSAR